MRWDGRRGADEDDRRRETLPEPGVEVDHSGAALVAVHVGEIGRGHVFQREAIDSEAKLSGDEVQLDHSLTGPGHRVFGGNLNARPGRLRAFLAPAGTDIGVSCDVL